MTEDYSSSTHPPLPPTTEEDRFDRLRLLRSRRVGPSTYRKLMAQHKSARAAMEALPDIARAAGDPDYKICPEGVIAAEMRAAKVAKARLVFQGDADYPSDLANIEDAPVLLWAVGQTEVLNRPRVALVGARNASSLGTRMARKLAHDLGVAGFTIVSGLARGVDAAAHDGALLTGTVAIVAGGVDVLYPAENADLAKRIGDQGLRLSDQPMGLQPHARHFAARNRIISGMTRATIVIEAAAKSGSMITARTALDQGRDVLAVPGHPYDARAAGCNMLIRDGAPLVRGVADIIEHVGDPRQVAQNAQPATPPVDVTTSNPLPDDILSILETAPMDEDQLMRSLGATPTAVAPLLMDLELDGKIIRQAGGILARAV